MKLEVGMYVRNDYFGIGKIDKDYFDSNNKHWFNVQFNCYGDDDCHCGICEQSIGYKASHNIIDLIEVGDYVNDLKVHGITDYGLEVYMFGDAHEILEENEIKTIVTKEQFSQMEYKIGGNE